MDPSEMDSKKKKELEKKKKESKDKENNTILLVAIKNGSVYSYVRENKLGKVLGLSSKYAPKGISKHGNPTASRIKIRAICPRSPQEKKHVGRFRDDLRYPHSTRVQTKFHHLLRTLGTVRLGRWKLHFPLRQGK
jgi:hypothetical protein